MLYRFSSLIPSEKNINIAANGKDGKKTQKREDVPYPTPSSNSQKKCHTRQNNF